jgi:flagellar biosynthesis/type III secretory pathway chaperone
MNLASASDRDVAIALDQQVEAMSAVLEALQSERAALELRDAEALASAVTRKQDTLNAAGVLEQQSRRILAELGNSRRRGGADHGLSARWQRLVGLTQQCRALNDGNGLMINGQRRVVEQTLRLLRGDNIPRTYGANGVSATGGPSGRTLASI